MPLDVRSWRNGRRAALRSLWGKTRGSSSLLDRTISFLLACRSPNALKGKVVFGAAPVEWLSQASLGSIVMIVSWQWVPFATLILLTAIQSLDSEQLEAAEMDGAPPISRFGFIIVPHLSRAIAIVILIQTIFLLSIFAEIFVTTGGSFGTRTLSYLIFQRVLESQNIGLGSAGGVYAIILANIVAIFLMRIVGKNLDA